MIEFSIANLNLKYQHQWVFQNFNLEFPAGQWTSILGPSGVGKSTILRFIANLLDTSEVKISGSIATKDNSSLASRISYLAQQDLLLPWLNVLENVLIGYRLRCDKNIAKHKKTALHLLQQVGLDNVAKMRPDKLSGGMRQRVALVRTLIENRPVILMDEPFSALDTITRLKMQNLAAELLQRKTVVLVTHDPLEALRLCDQIYILKGEPAKLSAPIQPQGTAPRNPADPQLLAEQAKLLQLLTEEETPC